MINENDFVYSGLSIKLCKFFIGSSMYRGRVGGINPQLIDLQYSLALKGGINPVQPRGSILFDSQNLTIISKLSHAFINETSFGIVGSFL